MLAGFGQTVTRHSRSFSRLLKPLGRITKVLLNSTTVFVLFAISLICALVVVDLPRVPIKLSNRYIDVDREIQGPDIDFELFGKRVYKALDLQLGLDIQGGTQLTLLADTTGIKEGSLDNALVKTTTIIKQRAGAYGINEPLVYTEKQKDKHFIIVEIPESHSNENTKSLLSKTAKLEFKELKDDVDLTDQLAYYLPENYNETGITGADIQRVSSYHPSGLQTSGQPETLREFLITLTPEGKSKLVGVAEKNVFKPLAVMLDGEMISAIQIPTEYAQGDVGRLTMRVNLPQEQVRELEVQLNSGEVPLSIELTEEQEIEASLGETFLMRSVVAGIISIALLGLFILLKFQFPGLAVDISLKVFVLLSIAVYKIIPITVTFAGIAGFTFSLFVATSSALILLHKIREERRSNLSFSKAVEVGIQKSWKQIIAISGILLFPAEILYIWAEGSFKTFGQTVLVGVLINIFCSYAIIRPLLIIYSRRELFERFNILKFRS